MSHWIRRFFLAAVALAGCASPGPPGAWPDIRCGDRTAREMLEFIRVQLDGPGGLRDRDPLRAQIILKIDACLAHPASGPTLTLEEHCAKVEHAFTEARKAAPNWTYIYSELEHMP